jgi:hypothetical protein
VAVRASRRDSLGRTSLDLAPVRVAGDVGEQAAEQLTELRDLILRDAGPKPADYSVSIFQGRKKPPSSTRRDP